MANFIAYTERLGNRNVPTLHIVEPYAGGGKDIINIGVNTGDSGNSTQGDYGTDASIAGMYGSAGPDVISYGTVTSSTVPFDPGNFRTVGVQIVRITSTRANGAVTSSIYGENLASYVEKTEYRYLKNGHLMIMVYFLESSMENILVDGGGLIINFNVLLQRQNSLVAAVDMRGEKRSIPVSLNAPVSTKFASQDSQNPSVKLDDWLYGNGGIDFARHVTVKNMGLESTGQIWNTVRTQAWSFQAHDPEFDVSDNPSSVYANNDARFWPHYRQCWHQGAGKVRSKHMSFDTSRYAPDVYTLGARNYSGLPFVDFPGSGESHLTYIFGSASNKTFDLLELFGQSISDNLTQPNGGTKEQWGKYTGLWSQHTDGNDLRNGLSPALTVGGYPSTGSGSDITEYTLSVQHAGKGLPQTNPSNSDVLGGRSRITLNGKVRNPLDPDRAYGVTGGLYVPMNGHAYSNYVTFYKIDGADWGDWNYLPPDMSQTPIGGGTASQVFWGGFLGDVVRQSMEAEAGGAGESGTIDSYMSPIDHLQGGPYDYANPSSMFQVMAEGFISWQDYMGSLFLGASDPTLDAGLEWFKYFYDSNEVTDSGLDIFDIRFSGVVLPTQGMTKAKILSVNTGLELLDTPTVGDNFYGLTDLGGGSDTIDPRGKKIFTYTVFVYTDSCQAKIDRSEQEPILGDVTAFANASGNLTYETQNIADGSVYISDGLHSQTHRAYQGIYYDIDQTAGNSYVGYYQGYRNWGSSDLVQTCVDRNSSVFSQSEDDSNASLTFFVNDNSCGDTSYNRCGCKQVVEDIATNELSFADSDPSDKRRFEAVVTYPRPVSTNQTTTIAPGSTFTSIVYVNAFYSVLSTTSSTNSNFRNAYLDIASTSSTNQVHWDTSSGIPYTHLLGTGDFSGLTDYPELLFFEELENKSVEDNTFTYTYMPGKEHYESDDGSVYFTHTGADMAYCYLTVGGDGSESSSTSASDDIEHRQYLVFEGQGDKPENSAKRAHADLSFTENWESANTEASYITIGTNSNCDSGNKDNPRRRVRWFVNVGRSLGEGIDDTDDGGDVDDVFGCTDPDAFNYNPAATKDDGSCINCDTEFTESPAGLSDLDPIFLIPHLYGSRELTGGFASIVGSTEQTVGVTTEFDGGCNGDLSQCPPEVTFGGSNTNGAEVYTWWDGNYFNAFNVRGPNADFTVGALNGASSPYTSAPHNNEADSSQTHFRMEAVQTVSSTVAAANAILDQYGDIDAAAASALQGIWANIGLESGSNVSLHIFRYEDWQNADHIAKIRNYDLGNNGWALDSYSGTLSSGTYKANVYSDTQGDFSGIGFQNQDELAIFANEKSGPWDFKFRFSSLLTGSLSTINYGLEAGHHYVAIVKFRPKRTCPAKDIDGDGVKDPIFYYWAYNFFVEYCACTEPASENGGYGNPDQSALTASQEPYFLGAPWNGVSYFPATNAPYSNITAGTYVGSGTMPTTFCGSGAASRFTKANKQIPTDTAALNNSSLCALRDPDATVTCDNFYSWCLSEIDVKCNFDEETGLPFGTLSFEVLIDGFFTQSEADPWNLQPVYETGVNPVNTYYLWEIQVFMNGEPIDASPIQNYIQDPNGPGYVLNPAVTITNNATGGATDFIGNLATLSFENLQWEDGDGDGVLDALNLTVNLVFLGTVNTSTGEVLYGYPPFVVDNADNPVTTCPIDTLTYDATLSGCEVSEQGCTDPLAINYNPDATDDDGSCIFRDCDELFDSYKSSIFITSVTTTPDTLNCETIDDAGTEINYYVPSYSATMQIVIEDYAAGLLGIDSVGLTQGQFTICVLRLQSGAATLLPAALQYFDENAAVIQNLNPGQAFSIGENDNGLNGCFIAPENPVTSGITSDATQTDPAGLPGTQYTTDVPTSAIFSQGSQLLTSGQYLLFVIPFVDISDLEDSNGYGLGDCETAFSLYIDEITTTTIGTTLGDDTCPEPCNQFTNPDDCPDAKPGCTDPVAENYNPDATFDDGSCEYCEDCDPCAFFPLDPECYECDKGEGQQRKNKVAGFGAKIRECDGETEECCTDPTACNYKEDCEVGRIEKCEYDCNDGGDECEGLADEECDDAEPTCPDPSNPECEGDPIGNCLDTGDCPCVGTQCNEDCVFEDANCDPPTVDPDDPIVDVFTTTTAICIPQSGPGATGQMQVYFADGTQATNLGEAAAACSVYNGDKMLMKMRTGVKYDDTDLLKLSLINYLLTRAVTTQLDCMLDCDNYESGAKNGGRILGHTSRFRGSVDCAQKWSVGKRQYFAGSSSYKQGDIVRYIRSMNGVMTGSYFIAKNDWKPGMDIPGTVRDTTTASWTPCINVRYQSGTNPENYYTTFYEFINRYCQSCTVAMPSARQNESSYRKSMDADKTMEYKPDRSFGSGFIDEDGNEITF